jgi:hypothetical protein
MQADVKSGTLFKGRMLHSFGMADLTPSDSSF